MAVLPRRYVKLLTEVVGLQTARGRVLFFGFASFWIFLLPISVLKNFSIWQKLGIDSPSIGLTRAYHYVLHGDLVKAWEQNGLIFIILLIGVPIIIKDVYNVTKQLMLRR
jgi:hypothetical protein